MKTSVLRLLRIRSKIILIKRNVKIKELSEKFGYKPNNFSNKLKADNFPEKELRRMAEILNCDYDTIFTMNDTKEII